MTTKPDDLRLHFEKIVLPALCDYYSAERCLTEAWLEDDQDKIVLESAKAERLGRTASIELHHLADAASKTAAAGLPAGADPRAVRDWVDQKCVGLRGSASRRDVSLLAAIADVFKHWELRSDVREIKAASDIEVATRGYGKGPFGEGKFGGAPQVWVFLRNGKLRPLTSVLQNVVDAWRVRLGWPTPEIGNFTT